MCVAQTAKRRRRQLRHSKLSRGRRLNAAQRIVDAKYGLNSVAKKRKR